MRRTVALFVTFLAVTATVLVLPVYAAPVPAPHPVASDVDEVPLGSVVDPSDQAVVTADGQVVPGGLSGSEATGTVAPDTSATPSPSPAPSATPTPTPAATPTETPSETDAPSSGDEVAGVPALTYADRSTDEFSSVGVTWRQDDVTGVVVQLRVKDDHGHWGDWTTLDSDVNDEPDSGDGGGEIRGGTAPYWTGPSRGVEVIVQGAGGVVPADVKVALIDPGTSAADSLAAAPAARATAHAAMTMPAVYSRAQWGADESLRTWDPEYSPTQKAVALHHTDNANNYTADQVPAMIRSIYVYHAVTRGWGDIGYNVIADRFGRLFEGRYGGLASTVIGAHTGGFNYNTFGISMLGNFDVAQPPQAMLDAVADFMAWKFSLFGIDPRGTVQLTSSGGGTAKYAAGTTVTLPTIFAHRDVGSTTCPGQYGYAALGTVRSRVAAEVTLTMSAIERRYASDSALRASLGAAVGGEQYGNGFAFQVYEQGRLYWSASTGVHLVRGDILAKYLAAGGPAVLGAPTTDEGVAGGGGAYNHFADETSIYWSPSTGAQLVQGAIRARWLALGAEWKLGYPTGPHGGVGPAGRGWVEQSFQNGDVYWSPQAGAAELYGDIRATWSRLGGLGVLGVPVTGLTYSGATALQEFAGGVTLAWSPSGGTHWVTGDIRRTWLARGGAGGSLGVPLTDELDTPTPGGRYNTFTGGSIVWSPTVGSVVLSGPIGQRWTAAGGVDAGIGLPTGPEGPTADGRGRVVVFSDWASIFWSQGGGAHLLRGPIGLAWLGVGGVSGFGLPVTDELPTGRGGGLYQVFVNGKVVWSAATGAQPLANDPIGRAYEALGSDWSPLGLPTSGEFAVSGGTRQNFQNGSLTYSRTTGKVTTAYR